MVYADYLWLLNLTNVKLFCHTIVHASGPNLVLDSWEVLHLLAAFILSDSPQCGKLLLVISRMLGSFGPVWGKSFPSYSKVLSHPPAWSSQSPSQRSKEMSLSCWEYHSVPWTSARRYTVLGMGGEAAWSNPCDFWKMLSFWRLVLLWLLTSLYLWSDSKGRRWLPHSIRLRAGCWKAWTMIRKF